MMRKRYMLLVLLPLPFGAIIGQDTTITNNSQPKNPYTTLFRDFTSRFVNQVKQDASETASDTWEWLKENITWEATVNTCSPYMTNNTLIGAGIAACGMYMIDRYLWKPGYDKKVKELANEFTSSLDRIGDIAWIDIHQVSAQAHDQLISMIENIITCIEKNTKNNNSINIQQVVTLTDNRQTILEDIDRATEWLKNNQDDTQLINAQFNDARNKLQSLKENIEKHEKESRIERTTTWLTRWYKTTNHWINRLSFGFMTWERLICIGLGRLIHKHHHTLLEMPIQAASNNNGGAA